MPKNISDGTAPDKPKKEDGRSGLRTQFMKEPKEYIEMRRKQAYRKLECIGVYRSPYEHGLGRRSMELGMPKRPAWVNTMSTEELESMEESAFEEWMNGILDRYSFDEINYFETNLQVWRQLWRTIEKSDIVVLVLDARFPLLHFSHALYDYVCKDLNKDMVLCINKLDLVPEDVNNAWKAFFEKHFPELPIAVIRGNTMNVLNKSTVNRGDSLLDAIAACTVRKNGDVRKAKPYVYPESDAQDLNAHEHREEHIVVGIAGDPNMGKSTLINQIFGIKRVSESATPGHTKHFQTLFLKPTLCFCDCPGVVFPKLSVGREIQVLFGSYPIAQTREPYSALRFLAEHAAQSIIDVYKLTPSEANGIENTEEFEWSPFDIAEAFSDKKRFYSKGGKADVYRGANQLLRDALRGEKVTLWFYPPTDEEYLNEN